MNPNSSLPGILLMTASVFFFAAKDVLAKMAGDAYAPVQIIWTQFAFMTAVYLPILVVKFGWGILIPRPLGWQIVRGLCIVTAMGLLYWSLILIPLADATAMAFTAPLIVTALSPLLLGEKVGWQRWAMVCLGFAGALILLRPAFTGDGLGYVVGFFAGVFMGVFYALNRKLATAAPPIASIAYAGYIGFIAATPFTVFNWTPPQEGDGWIIFGFVVLAAIGQTLLISAFRYGQASLVAPFHYVQILAATLFGWMFFEQLPDGYTWLGVAIVVGSGLYIAIREGQQAKAATKAG